MKSVYVRILVTAFAGLATVAHAEESYPGNYAKKGSLVIEHKHALPNKNSHTYTVNPYKSAASANSPASSGASSLSRKPNNHYSNSN